VIFFYELLFFVVAVVAIFVGEIWSRLVAFLMLSAFVPITALGAASFGARLATADGLTDDERRFFADARAGLRHLALLFGLASLAALAWKLIAG
jgi:hypothetical protein